MLSSSLSLGFSSHMLVLFTGLEECLIVCGNQTDPLPEFDVSITTFRSHSQ